MSQFPMNIESAVTFLFQRSHFIKALYIPYKERHCASRLLNDLNHFVLSFPPLRITLPIYYFVEIISLHVNTSSEHRKHLIMGLKQICSILGSVKLFSLSSK